MAMTANQYLAQLQALLPSGAAWTREPDADLTNAMLAIATELARIDARLDDLVNEGDVRTATELMTDWERVLGLPDDCMANTVLTLAQRRLLALQRLVEEGGQSAAYYIGLAELLGEPGCTVSEFRPMNCNDNCNSALGSQGDRFFWRFNIPHAPANLRPMNCNDNCNSALQVYTPSLAECPIRERKPAHTQVLFTYVP
jgi:uncharacterized protein YmfQ (DUF2313 family)